MCFKWAILSALHPAKSNSQRLSNYKRYENELNFDGIEFPVSVKDIDKFMKQNETISVNVYYYDDAQDHVYPLRISSNVREHHIHLLLIIGQNRFNTNRASTTAEKMKAVINSNQIQSHYCWIKDLSKLVNNQLNSHGHKLFLCDRCLNYFEKVEKLDKHLEDCTNECQIEMPEDTAKWTKFTHYSNQLMTPFIIYADTEAYLKRLNVNEQNNVFSEECKTNAYQEHRVYSVGYYFKCAFDDTLSYYASSENRKDKNQDCIDWFIKELKDRADFLTEKLDVNVPMRQLTWREQDLFHDVNTPCSICTLPFKPTDKRAHDHCHFTGEYRGPAHISCNLNYQPSRVIPIVMHNLSGYDAHLFIKKLATKITGNISIIPNNMEQYISFTKTVINENESKEKDKIKRKRDVSYKDKIRLKFIDSCRFMPASLSDLAELLPTSKKRILYAECQKDYSSEQMTMLERKGVFPYDYVDNPEKLNETALPTKDQFYSELNDSSIDENEYKFACEIWKKFNIKTLGQYSELYLKTDVLLLADVFENFRETCHTLYQLDPAHYLTAPGLSFDAMLKYTGASIELLTDVEMLLFIERGIRGGITQCNKRHVKANNKYMKTAYNPDEKSRFLMYLDGKLHS